MGSSEQIRIGKVVEMLKDEFADVSISKLRFLEDQGLVQPLRTPGGYRMYTPNHVEELRAVLRMQRDEFLPLRVIKDELHRRLSGTGPGAGAVRASKVSLTAPEEFVSLVDLCRRAQVTPEFVNECREADLVNGVQQTGGSWAFSLHECGIVQSAGQMRRLGIDVRHLRQVRVATGHVAGLVEQYAAARLRVRNVEQREQAVKAVESLTQSLTDFMRLACVRDVRSMTSRVVAASSPSAREQEPLVRS
jgi:DNA-binding transcriptional MerR regulator